ncbi:GNAT family N-acetyltransferase [Paludicola sp. MB14-C6]|uniref:GNAT family N-acetyltransferase n=1 Tax=Paludihabitans sp. MB14-C6 TaxID=3070656 RepID=UPI0027DB3788|nr:GNAT family N-acetyltransferase [Paludicola sp. MB14-C6]WMJ22421.1 GNAT family N-acetyltransferase [Paludicola sp. MB14-C6]
MFSYNVFDISLIEEVKEIYIDSNWSAYLKDDEKLKRAFDNSLYLLGTFDNGKLIGFIRCVGDGEHILIVQDLIVKSQYQKKGIGTHLFKAVWDKYVDVRMFQVITDIEDEVDNHFYQSFHMKKLEDGHMVSYFR